ncbi:hypothetical protein BP6252_08166 [Coleophoma cylindrospora]|uniref:Uncharacterized protein n=1 Tax=Coleophoma cylindrospora TaxID=1849047 RepID=A0A3D8RC27_9HELO|nr:hypothetical protein BP6252_08166 [Coleophoma cylindrospora]
MARHARESQWGAGGQLRCQHVEEEKNRHPDGDVIGGKTTRLCVSPSVREHPLTGPVARVSQGSALMITIRMKGKVGYGIKLAPAVVRSGIGPCSNGPLLVNAR